MNLPTRQHCLPLLAAAIFGAFWIGACTSGTEPNASDDQEELQQLWEQRQTVVEACMADVGLQYQIVQSGSSFDTNPNIELYESLPSDERQTYLDALYGGPSDSSIDDADQGQIGGCYAQGIEAVPIRIGGSYSIDERLRAELDKLNLTIGSAGRDDPNDDSSDRSRSVQRYDD